MKEIKAVIRPSKLSALRDALMALPGFPGMTVTKVEGCSAPVRHIPAKVRIRDELTDYTAKVRVEIVAADEVAGGIYDCISQVARTGSLGDGLVWVTPVEEASFVFKSMSGDDPIAG